MKYAIDRDVIVGRVGRECRHGSAHVSRGVPRRSRRGSNGRSRRPLLLVELRSLGESDGPGVPDGGGRATPPGTICGTSFTPAVVAAVAGLILSKNPSLTGSQVVAALRVTARPVVGVAYGRVDPVAAFRWLGLLNTASPAAATPPRHVDASGADAGSGQLYTRQTLFETGTFKRDSARPSGSGRGGSSCSCSRPSRRHARSRSTRRASSRSPRRRQELISLSVRVTAGRYTAEVQCRGARTRQYSLGVIAMFPRTFR